MCKLIPGLRVVVVDDNHELKKGVIKASYEAVRMAIVELDDDTTVKVNYDSVGVDPEVPVETEEPIEAEEIVDEITISKIQFMDILSDLVIELTKYNARMALAFTIFGAKLATKLFDND